MPHVKVLSPNGVICTERNAGLVFPQKEELCRRANAFPSLVQALVELRDLTHSGTARDDFSVRQDAFRIAQRELVALGEVPYEDPATAVVTPSASADARLLRALRAVLDVSAHHRSMLGSHGFDETPVEHDAEALLRELGAAS